MTRIETYLDPDFGAISAAYDDGGAIVATASSGIDAGVYVAVDEGTFYEATGHLLPMQLWEAALLDDHDAAQRPVSDDGQAP